VIVTVDSIYRAAFWTWSHVFKEEREVAPPLADFDASASVPTPILHLGTSAAHPHGFPDFVSSGSGLSVPGSRLTCSFFLEAAA
jgi:hypothetical protein